MTMEKYDVALSFAGEDRKFAKELASELKKINLTVFYDEYEQADLWGKDLFQHLQKVYRDNSQYCVIFSSQNYQKKVWTKHELKQAQARAIQENREYILPLRLDGTEIPGINETTGYIDIKKFEMSDIAQMIADKIKKKSTSITQHYILEIDDIHDDFIHALSFSPDDNYLISGSKDFSINVFNLSKKQNTRNLKSHSLESWCVTITDQFLVAGFWQRGVIQVWSTSEWILVKEIDAHPLSVRSVEFTPDRKLLGSCAHDGKIKLWDFNNSQPIVELSAHPAPCTSIAFSPDNKFLASSGDEGAIIVWDRQSYHKLYSIHPEIPLHALSVKYSVDGKCLIACFADITPKSDIGNCVKIFDTKDGRTVHTLSGHEKWVWCLAVHPNNHWVASGGYDGRVIIWDIKTGDRVGDIIASLDRIYSVVFSNNGELMATTGWDKCVRVWKVLDLVCI